MIDKKYIMLLIDEKGLIKKHLRDAELFIKGLEMTKVLAFKVECPDYENLSNATVIKLSALKLKTIRNGI